MSVTDAKLAYLAEAAALGSMRAASEKLDVAVSSISRQITQLESELGLPLIERGRRSIKLTEAGELAIRFYRDNLIHRESFASGLQALKGLRAGQICVAAGEGFVSILSIILEDYLNRHSGVLLSINMAGTLDVIRQVREDEAHIGLVFHAPPDPKINVRATIPQPIKLIVHPRHPLAEADSVTLKELESQRLCLPEPTFRIRQMIALGESVERVTLNPHVNTNSLTLLKDMVKSGGYAALLPESAALIELNRRELKAVPVANAALQETSLNLICRLGRTLPAAPAALLPLLESGMRLWARKNRGTTEAA
jgi:DNA-binding transcriptional LysR family regulator